MSPWHWFRRSPYRYALIMPQSPVLGPVFVRGTPDRRPRTLEATPAWLWRTGMHGATTADLLARLEAMAARLDTQDAVIAAQAQEITRLSSAAHGSTVAGT